MIRQAINSLLRPFRVELVRHPVQVIPAPLPDAGEYSRPEEHYVLFRPWRGEAATRWITPAVRGNTMLSPQKLYTLRQCVRLTRGVAGDIFEAGTGSGGAARLMLDVSRDVGVARHGWFLDTFEGYQKVDAARDGAHVALNQCRLAPREAVAELLRDSLSEAHVIAGLIPATLAEVRTDRIAFAHIDVNLYEPTLAATEFCLKHLAPGGVMLFDDYNWPACYGARQAIDEACAKAGQIVISLPESTQAVLFKP